MKGFVGQRRWFVSTYIYIKEEGNDSCVHCEVFKRMVGEQLE